MKIILLVISILCASLHGVKAQDSVLFADLGNQWASQMCTYQQHPAGCWYAYYTSDTVYHIIDSSEYIFISDAIRDLGCYVRYDSITGILYGRGYKGKFGIETVYDSTEFILMRKDAMTGDTIKIPALKMAFVVTEISVDSYDLVVKKPLKHYYFNLFHNNGIDDNYQLNQSPLYRMSFNFTYGFPFGPFFNHNYTSMHNTYRARCFWSPTYKDTSVINCYDYIILSDNSIKYKAINIYPNPVNDYIQISGDHIDLSKQNTIIIYNSIGQQVNQTIIYSIHDRINTQHLSNGMYYINLIQNGKTIGSSKFVK